MTRNRLSTLLLALAAPRSPRRLPPRRKSPIRCPTAPTAKGPWDRVILRGPIVIDGTGAPPYGPVDIIVQGNVIHSIHNVGTGVTPIHEEDPARRRSRETTRLISTGTTSSPGFLDMHLHQHNEGEGQRVPTEYIHKLWMAHGIATGADVGNFNTRWLLHHARRSWNNEITSPRIQSFVVFGRDGEGAGPPIRTRPRRWGPLGQGAGRRRDQVSSAPSRGSSAPRSTRRRSRGSAPPRTTPSSTWWA